MELSQATVPADHASSADPTLAADPTADETLAAGSSAAGVTMVRGEIVGRYVVLRKLGAGGMGVVYLAYDPELERKIRERHSRRFGC